MGLAVNKFTATLSDLGRTLPLLGGVSQVVQYITPDNPASWHRTQSLLHTCNTPRNNNDPRDILRVFVLDFFWPR